MNKHTTLKARFNSAFSLVELLVVIAVIAIIAAIAIPNITGILDDAETSANKRTAQNLASLASAAAAAGHTNDGAIATWVGQLTNGTGILVTNIAGNIFGPFRADGVPTNNAYQAYLATNAGGTLSYKQAP